MFRLWIASILKYLTQQIFASILTRSKPHKILNLNTLGEGYVVKIIFSQGFNGNRHFDTLQYQYTRFNASENSKTQRKMQLSTCDLTRYLVFCQIQYVKLEFSHGNYTPNTDCYGLNYLIGFLQIHKNLSKKVVVCVAMCCKIFNHKNKKLI